jgi:hypothetical protein
VNFQTVLDLLSREFTRRRIRHGLIGGMAVSILGTPRATRDLDFLVHRDDLAKVDAVMGELGYRRTARTENFTRYEGRWPHQGAVDIQHAFRAPGLAMLGRARARKVPGLKRAPRVLQREDLVGLKLQAMVNDPDRTDRDRADISDLLRGRKPRWARVLGYYDDFGRRREGLKLRRKLTGR